MPTQTSIPATLAFVFSPDLSQVLLIEKQKPEFHKGLLNGLGGKLEAGESHLECVRREVVEEAGLTLPAAQWTEVGSIAWTTWQVSVWTTVLEANEEIPTSFPDPQVRWVAANNLPEKVISNLRWLIPLCQDVQKKVSKLENPPRAHISY